jgi:hypothetical protein
LPRKALIISHPKKKLRLQQHVNILYLDTKITHTTTPKKALIISHCISQTVLNLYPQKNPKIETESYDINNSKDATQGKLFKESCLNLKKTQNLVKIRD